MQKQTRMEKKQWNNQKQVFKIKQIAPKIYFQKIWYLFQICIFGLSKPKKDEK